MKRDTLLATLLFTLLWAALTWPQAARMSDSVNDVGDPLLNTWAIAWIAHQLPFAPAHVFDGNIFHPERRTLAYSETLLAPGAIGAPLLWLGAGPILVYNLLLMASFVLSGLFTFLLVVDLTGSAAAGLVAGAIFGFLPFRFDHYAHFQLLVTPWMPMALWGLHRFLAGPRLRWAVVLGAAVGAQALTSMYNALFLGVFLAVVGGILVLTERQVLRRRLPGLLVAMGLAGVLAAPAGIAHLRVREVVGERSRGEVVGGSAALTDFLSATPGNALYGRLTRNFGGPERRLFIGWMAVALAVVALWPPISRTRMAYAAGLVIAIEMARGLNGWLYPLFYEYVLGFRGLRVPARMAIMAGLAVAVLAGFGLARLLERLGSARARQAATALVIGVVALETWSAPLRLARIPTEMPPTYVDLLADKGQQPPGTIIRRLSDPAPAVLVELPFGQEDPTFMYYATFHWQSLANGYSGFHSERFAQLHHQLQQLPSREAQEALARVQARYVTVHGELMSRERYLELTAALERLPGFRLISKRPWQGSEIALYRFRFVED